MMKMRLGLLAIVAMLLAMIAVACQTAQVSSQKLEVGSAHVRHSRQQNLAMAEAASVLDSVTGRPLLHKHMKLHKTTAIASIEATHVEVEEPIGGAAAVSAVTVADATGEPLAVSASPVFKTGPPSPEDCQQKTIADCYFVAAQKALCGEHPEEISALVKDVDAAHVGTIWWNGASWSAVLQGKAIPTYFGTPAASWPYLQEKSWCWARTGTNTYSSIANGSFTQVASKWGRSSSWYYENVGNAAHSDAQLSALIAANDTNGVPQVCLTLGQPNTSNNPPNLPANHFLWIRGLNSSGYALLSNPLSPPNTAPIVMSIATLRLNILCYEYSANRLYPIPAVTWPVTPPATQPTTQPTTLPAAAPVLAVTFGSGSANLSWSAVTGAAQYEWTQSTDGVNFYGAKIAATQTTQYVPGLIPDKNYWFRVRADAGPWSNVVAIRTPFALKFVGVNSSMISFSWTAVTEATSYIADYSTSPTFSPLTSTPTPPTIKTDINSLLTKLAPATTYYIRVRAMNGTTVVNTSGTLTQKTGS